MGLGNWFNKQAEKAQYARSDELWDKAEREGYRLEVTQRRGMFGGQSPTRMQYEWVLYKGARPVTSGRAISAKNASNQAGLWLAKRI
jgi:hypothetical protein